MSAPMQALALRGSQGLWLNGGAPDFNDVEDFPREEGSRCRTMTFSSDGSLFAWQNGLRIRVMSMSDRKILYQLDRPRANSLTFSPCSTIFAVWEPYITSKDIPAGTPNLNLYDAHTGQHLKSFIHKTSNGWCPQWSLDEEICAQRVNNELHVFEKNNFDTVVQKLHLPKVQDFVMAKTKAPYHIAAHVQGNKGQPSFIKLFRYPHLDAQKDALAHKSFFKADKVQITWSPKGKAVLILTSVEASDTSYYGEQGLHYASIDGDSSLVPLAKNGPVYSVEWNPSSTEFCAVYGFMPAKATIYNTKCEPVFDFGTGPRNVVYYNAHGNIAGFGALRGNMEFWDVKQRKLITQQQADDTTHFEWAPDGEHILTATTAPRLRVSNGFKVWHYSGALIHKQDIPTGQELWQITWQSGQFPEKPVSYKKVAAKVLPQNTSLPNVKAGVYRPPSARGLPKSTIKLHDDYEPASNLKKTEPENMSKQALKNKKKREAKKAAKQEEPVEQAAASVEPQAQSLPTTGDPETDKKIRNLRKKLQQIEKLKDQQKEGKTLEKNQLEKLKSEDALLKELKDLSL